MLVEKRKFVGEKIAYAVSENGLLPERGWLSRRNDLGIVSRMLPGDVLREELSRGQTDDVLLAPVARSLKRLLTCR